MYSSQAAKSLGKMTSIVQKTSDQVQIIGESDDELLVMLHLQQLEEDSHSVR